MVVAQGVDGDPADEVEVAPAVDVPDPGPVAVVEDELGAPEQVQQRALVALDPGSGGLAVVADAVDASLIVDLPIGQNHGADTLGREHLEQQAVRLAPVDDVRLGHPGLDGPDAGLELGDHPGVDGL